jgi:hypothetical protein
MAKKFGTDFAKDMLDRGRRELGGALFTDSNVAQPMYPLHARDSAKEAEPPTVQEEKGSILESRMKEVEASKEDPGREDRGMDRE